MSAAGYPRIAQRSVTTGTGPFELLPSRETSFGLFRERLTTGDVVPVMIVNPGKNEWQECLCTFTQSTPDTLTVLKVIASSSVSDAAVAFTGGSKVVMLCVSSYTLRAIERLRPAVRCLVKSNQALAGVIEGSTLDGLTLAAGDRVALCNQTTTTEIGLYDIQAGGDPPTRCADFAAGDTASGALVTVLEGTYAGAYAICTSVAGSDVVGTDTLSWFINGPGVWQPLDATLTAVSGAGTTGTGAVVRGTSPTIVTATLTSPTIDTPTINGSGGPLTLPAGPTNLVGDDTAQTLTNKSIDAGQLTGTIDAARMPALTGDISTTVGTVSTSLGSHVVSYGKLQQVAANSLLGNPTGSLADAQEITLASRLAFATGALDLATIGSAIGPLGAAGTVPIVTIDVYGRVTALTSTAITGEALTLSDVTTNNVSTSKHGLMPKLDGTATHFMDQTGVQRALAAGDLGTTMAPQFSYIGLNVAPDSTYVLKGDNSSANCLASLTTGGATSQAGFNFGYPGQTFRIAANGAFVGLAINDVTGLANRVLIEPGGNFKIGNTGTAIAKFESRSASGGAQNAASWDNSNYMLQSVNGTGLCTWTGAGTSKGHVFTDGIAVGTGSDRAKIAATRKTIATTSTNSGTGETDLHSLTIAANSLVTDGDVIDFVMGFFTAGNANNKAIKIYFGGTQIFTTGLAAASSSDVLIRGRIMRTGSANQVSYIDWSVNSGSAWTAGNVTRGAPSATLSSSAILKATGQGGASSDITQNLSIVKYIPAN